MLRRGAKIAHDKYGKTPMNDAAENEQLEVRGKQMDSLDPKTKTKTNGFKRKLDPCKGGAD